MKLKHPFSVFFVFGLVAILGLSSCASFQLVSQRPSGNQAVDAVAAATSDDGAAPATTETKKPAASADAVTSDTGE